ncbi:MAG: S24 family peptidase, partial [Aeromonas sp.]
RGYGEDGQEVFELVPLNDDYPTMRSDRQPIQIIGSMVEHRRRRKRQ